ncbi:MAG: TIGR02221 family CRISPR-associated protein [Campylobacterota bacterium]|nr:TIGR02221 family CRISPR-associated protein [Campylobacterota bacterium]
MAKILISSLGTGQKREEEYQKATYQIDDKTYTSSFIAHALSEHLKIDKLFLVGTNKSIWDEAYKAFGGDDDGYHMDLYEKKDRGLITQEDLLVFNETVSKKLGADGSKASVIKFGINDDELWEIFERYLEIADTIEDGDELYLDITHSFRSLSMMSLVMSQFAASISDKKFQLKGVYYGMLEYQGETEKKIAPIVNLNILFELQEWIKAIDAIKKYSDFDPLVEILNKEDIEVKVDNVFTELNNAIDMANMAAIQKFVQNASKKIRAIASSENKIIKLLSAEVIKLVDELNHDRMSDFQYALAKWFYKNKNYAMSYMALAEAIVTKNCELKNLDRNDLEKENQKEVKTIVYPYDKHFQTKYEGSISDIRNNIAHQLDARSDNTKRDIEKLQFFIDEFESYFKKERVQ